MIVEPDTADYLSARLRSVTDELREARAEIRRLRLRLALATSRVTPWRSRWLPKWWNDCLTAKQAVERVTYGYINVSLGDGTPEQEQP